MYAFSAARLYKSYDTTLSFSLHPGFWLAAFLGWLGFGFGGDISIHLELNIIPLHTSRIWKGANGIGLLLTISCCVQRAYLWLAWLESKKCMDARLPWWHAWGMSNLRQIYVWTNSVRFTSDMCGHMPELCKNDARLMRSLCITYARILTKFWGGDIPKSSNLGLLVLQKNVKIWSSKREGTHQQ